MKTTVAVFFGGRSVEHEISVISASQAMHAMNRDKYNVIPVYITKQGRWVTGDALFDVKNYRDMKALVEKCEEVYMRPEFGDFNLYRAKTKLFGGHNVYAAIDVVIPVLHGTNGEDGIFEGVLETIGVPYAGCNTVSSANGMDKVTMKMILKDCDIPVVDYVWFTDKQWYHEKDELVKKVEERIGYPVIVKPANLGSSVGISCAKTREELLDSVETAQQYSTRIIVEDMVENLKEINCSVLGDCDDCQPSILEEPIKTGAFLSYDDKYKGGTKGAKGMQASDKRIPADLPKDITERIQFLAKETFRVLSCHGVSRVDFMVDASTNNVFVNEINTIPGSLSFYLWEATGIKFDELMDRLVQLALKRKREQGQKTTNFDQNIFSLGGGVKGAKGAKC